MTGTTEKDQKTEQPTAKKLSDSAREGDVLMSRELATALMMLAAAGWMIAAGGWFVQSAGDLLRRGLTLTAADVADFAPGARPPCRLTTPATSAPLRASSSTVEPPKQNPNAPIFVVLSGTDDACALNASSAACMRSRISAGCG